MAFNKNYLQIDFTSGNFYAHSPEPKEGFEKNVSTKGNTTYRKYYKDGVTGTLEAVSIRESKIGNQISVNIKDGEEIYYLSIGLADQKGNVDNNYAESLIKFLPDLNRGQIITIRGYNFTPDGEKYSRIGISIKSGGEKLKATMTNSYYKDGNLVNGDIPALTFKKDALGKNRPTAVSQEAKNDYLLEVLKAQTERLAWVNSNGETQKEPTPPSNTATPVKANGAPQPVEEGNNDDLPF